MKDFCSLKKPHGVFFNRKNETRPFEDPLSLEFFSKKNDASLFMFGSHNKKRPHNLIIGRMYDYHVLDMLELGVESFQPLAEFEGPKIPVGTKPVLLFAGETFETEPDYQRLKNLFLDFFRGQEISRVRLQGLEHVIIFIAVEDMIYWRNYRILMKKSGTKIPRIELVEMGPRMNLSVRRTKLASEDMFKLAKKQPSVLKPKKKKNVKQTALGSTVGRIHMKRQDFGKLQTRKIKSLKKTKPEQTKFGKNSKSLAPVSNYAKDAKFSRILHAR
ncbi:ribosome production factor 2 homolog isoform X2 [Limulus polyphemus]|nr:ribosome production factor 2 homolog isoform X2 [Limulus polyphemus]